MAITYNTTRAQYPIQTSDYQEETYRPTHTPWYPLSLPQI